MRVKPIGVLAPFAGILFSILLLTIIGIQPAFADTIERTVSSYSELCDAIAQSEDGDSILFGTDIIVDDAITISKSITINGNGHSIKVPSPGFLDSGVLDNSASNFRVFSLEAPVVIPESPGITVVLENITIMGGSVQGGALSVGSNVTASLNYVSILNSGGSVNAGGGIYNRGTLYIDNSTINRNGGNYGGGFLNSGFMVIENSSFSENRSLSSSGGGGAGENGGQLYINNCTFSNNKSTELGGAINDYNGMAYIMNSTFTGNVTYSTSYKGGALRGDASVVVNCIFAYNYCLPTHDYCLPTCEYCASNCDYCPFTCDYCPSDNNFILNDYDRINEGNSYSDFRMVSSIFHSQDINGYSNRHYTGESDGSDNSLVSKGITTRVLAADGSEAGDSTVFQPFLYTPPGASTSIVPLKEPLPEIVKSGVRTIFDPYADTPIFAYFNEAESNWYTSSSEGYTFSWSVLNDPDLTKEVTTDQLGNERNGGIGGTEYVASALYMVKLIYLPDSAHGTVHGATVYGDVYSEGETVTIISNPDQGYYFDIWKKEDSSDLSVNNPLKFTISEDVTLYPFYIQNDSLSQLNLDVDITPPLDKDGSFKAKATLSGDADTSAKPITFYVVDETGKIVYSETKMTDEDGQVTFTDWSPTDPDAKYEGYVSFPGDNTSGATLEGPTSLSTGSLVIFWINECEATYGQTIADIVIEGESSEIPGVFSFQDITESVGDTGTRTITRYFTPDDSGYNEPIPHEMTLNVTPKELTTAMISVSDCTYNGEAQNGNLVVTDGSPSLLKESDYTVSYLNNVEVGTAQVTVTATDEGNYFGSVTRYFNILEGPSDPESPDHNDDDGDTGDNNDNTRNDSNSNNETPTSLANTGDNAMFLVFYLAITAFGAFLFLARKLKKVSQP